MGTRVSLDLSWPLRIDVATTGRLTHCHCGANLTLQFLLSIFVKVNIKVLFHGLIKKKGLFSVASTRRNVKCWVKCSQMCSVDAFNPPPSPSHASQPVYLRIFFITYGETHVVSDNFVLNMPLTLLRLIFLAPEKKLQYGFCRPFLAAC